MTTQTTSETKLPDYPRYVPADARVISRLLKAEGFKRADKGSHYGFQVTAPRTRGGARVFVWLGSASFQQTEATETQAKIRETLLAKGYRFDPKGSMEVYRPLDVKKEGDSTFWTWFWMMHGDHHDCDVLVEIDGKMVYADEVPEYRLARERTEAWILKANRERKEAEAKKARAAKQRKEALVKALEARGIINVVPVGSSLEGSTRLSLTFDDLANLLGMSEEVAPG